MKKQFVVSVLSVILIGLANTVMANEMVTIAQAKALDVNVNRACELAREQALLQAKQNQARLIRSQMTLIETDNNGVITKSYEDRTDLYQMVEAGFVEPPMLRKQLVGDRVECTVMNAKIWIDDSELAEFKQTLQSENILRRTRLEQESNLTAELNQNAMRYQQLKQQAMNHQQGNFNEVIFCEDNESRQGCTDKAKRLLEKQKAQTVASALGVTDSKVNVEMTSDLSLVEGAPKLNGRDYLLKGIAQYDINVLDPFADRNRKIQYQLAALKGQSNPNDQKVARAPIVEAKASRTKQGPGFFDDWHFMLAMDTDMSWESRISNEREGGLYGLTEQNALFAEDIGVGFEVFPGNDYLGFYVGVAQENWAQCSAVQRRVCSEVDKKSFTVMELGTILNLGILSVQLNQVSVGDNDRFVGNYEVPNNYFKWTISLNSQPLGSSINWHANYGDRDLPNLSESKADSVTNKTYVLGIGVSFAL